LERYVSICYSAGIEPVMVISKIDLVADIILKDAISKLEAREKKIKYILLSNLTREGLNQIIEFLQKGNTYCVVGSSGVGKSTLINNLLKKNILKTGEISRSTNKGRHISDHRELFILENGGIIIDTPGMRELGMTDNTNGIETAFQEIHDLSLKCKFPDCKHINETECAVLKALDEGLVDRASLVNFQKLQREQQRFQITVAEKRRKERIFGKMLKSYKKDIKNTEF
jgi:ribosome biogenesis GTPase